MMNKKCALEKVRKTFMEKKRKRKKDVVCCLITDDENRILMGIKKRGFGEGKLQLPAGKIEHESKEQAIIREVNEETDLLLENEDLSYIGHVTFEFVDNDEVCFMMYIFSNQVFRENKRM